MAKPKHIHFIFTFSNKIKVFAPHILIGCSYHWLHPIKTQSISTITLTMLAAAISNKVIIKQISTDSLNRILSARSSMYRLPS
jgi:hypothetical protein